MGWMDRLRGGQVAAMPPPAVVAAATRVIPGDRESVKAIKRQQAWQEESWSYFDTLGEVKYAANFIGDNLSRVRLFPAVRESPTSEPQPDDNPAAQEAVQTELGDQADMMREAGINMAVAGELYLTQEEDEPLEVRSTAEVEVKSQDNVHIKDDPDDTSGRRLSDDAFVGRLWRRHPRFSSRADAPIRGALSSCEEILMIERMIRSTLRSRHANGKILFVPEGMSLIPPDPTRSQQDGEAREDPFLATLEDAMMTAIQEEGRASSIVPLVIQGDGDMGEQIRVIDLVQDLPESLLERLESAIRRLSHGVELPPEIVTGMAEVNHWGQWQIERSTWKAHLEPKAVTLVEAISRVWYRPRLEAAGVDPTGRLIWFDPSALITPTPTAEDAATAHKAYAISDESFRSRLGFDESDAPTDDEVRRRVKIDIARRSNVSELPGGGDPLEGEQAPGGPPEPPSVVAAAAPSRLSERLADIDRTLADRLDAAADEAMRRALEKAGARVRSKAQASVQATDAIANVDNIDVPSTLGRKLVETFDIEARQLVEGEFDRFGDTFRRRCSDAQQQTRRTIPVGASVDEGAQEEDCQQAWVWLRSALVGAALGLLFTPGPGDRDGEVDATALVDFGLVREAMARAGGAGRTRRLPGVVRDAATALRTRGVATGVRTLNALEAVGIAERAIVWDYRPAIVREPFEPHRRLHDLQFERLDDDRLANPGGWPASSHYRPGDHPHCRCVIRPVLAEE